MLAPGVTVSVRCSAAAHEDCYAPVARLAHGGMADVFLAVQKTASGLSDLAVVKRLRHADEEGRLAMFLDEARLSASLRHPNVVRTLSTGEVGGQFYIAMEYLEGQSLREVLEGLGRPRVLPPALAAFIACKALRGLHYAHEARGSDGVPMDLIHRDISPHNVFLTSRGEIKLLDFGMAKARGNLCETESGVLKGKVRYMAPEQVVGDPIDRRLDIFAFGLVVWEMLAGRALFEGDAVAILTRIASQQAPSIRTTRPDVCARLDRIVTKALRLSPAERYQTADEMRFDLESFLEPRGLASLQRQLTEIMDELFASRRQRAQTRIAQWLRELPYRVEPWPALSDPLDDLPALDAENAR